MSINPTGLANFGAWLPVIMVVVLMAVIIFLLFSTIYLYFQLNRNYNSALRKYFSYFKNEPSKPPRTSAARSGEKP